jgi:uncharacterized protein (TIGR02598 family)
MTQAESHSSSPHLPSPTTNPPAFSLIEVVIALGIVAFAVIAIVGMLPIALKSSQNTMRETDATIIAQRIFSELKTDTGANRTFTINTNGDTETLSLTSHENTNNFLGFKNDGEVQNFTKSPTNKPALDFYAQISVFTNTGTSNLSRIQIDITYPPSAPPGARTTNSFVTLLGF